MSKLTDFQLFENAFIFIIRIKYYTENLSEQKLLKDIKTSDAVMYNIQQLGKNISRISDEFKKKNKELTNLDWTMLSMFKMDDYFSYDDFWDVIQSILPYFDKMEAIYLRERTKLSNKEESKIPDKFFKPESLPLDTHYNYLIHSHSSVWTVKKR